MFYKFKTPRKILIFFCIIIIILIVILDYELQRRRKRIPAEKYLKRFSTIMETYKKTSGIYPSKLESLKNYTHPPPGTDYYRYYVSKDVAHFIYAAFPTSPSNGRYICFVDESNRFFKADMWELWHKVKGRSGGYPDVLQIDWSKKGSQRLSGLDWIEFIPEWYLGD